MCVFSQVRPGEVFGEMAVVETLAAFRHGHGEIAKMHPKPVLQLFGGEPTVRDDLLEIHAIAYKHGLETHLTTNGLRLADDEYCKKICEAQIGLRFSLDGLTPEIYARFATTLAPAS